MRTVRLKVRQEAYQWLNAAAIEVNQVWNWCNERSCSVYRNTGKRLSGFDLVNATAGTTNYMRCIGSGTVNAVCLEFANKRRGAMRPKLRWRHSFGARRSLGWVPFKGQNLHRSGNAFSLIGKTIRVFNRERLSDSKIRDGSLTQDSCGDWWLCIPVDTEIVDAPAPMDAVGIDLGLKTAAVASDGRTLESRVYRSFEPRISQAQRRGNKMRAKRLHRKAARCRADAMHKFSTALVRDYQRIFVGDVSSTKLVKTKMAKSVLDAGWGMLKTQLEYKCQQAAREFRVVNESNTTRACSGCGALTGPTGLDMLSVRQWICDACGEAHSRDVNAARNIQRRGEASPSVSRNEVQP